MKKITLVLVAILVAVFGLTACGDRPGTVPINRDMTQLYVGVFEGGFGPDWVYAAAKRFEERYKDHSFEEGKKGVQVYVTESRSFTMTGMDENISYMTEEIIFAEGANALYFAKRGDFLDVSDVVTSPLNYDFVFKTTDPKGESGTIEDKLSQTQQNYFSHHEGKYYALPATEKFFGLAYDIELFEDNNLYFAPDGNFVINKYSPRSAGPDGKMETSFDNGLPATYEQFFKLCDKIASLELIPVMWGGTVQEYVSSLLIALSADFEGVEQAELNYNFNGTLQNPVISFDVAGNPVIGSPITITPQTGYNMYKQLGRYHALKFLEGLTAKQSNYNHTNATSNSFSHQDAEGVFVSAKYSSTLTRAAMLIDGNWWQSEARGVFNDLAAIHGIEASLKERKFGLMPLPKPTENDLGDYTILQLTGDISFVNAKIAAHKIDLAKSFLQFCYTDESLREFTVVTNVCRAVKYDMGERYDELSTWGKAVVDIHNSANIAVQDSASLIMQNYSVDLWYSPNLWLSTVGGKTNTYPTYAMINDKISAKDYFNGMSTYWTPTTWSSKFRNI